MDGQPAACRLELGLWQAHWFAFAPATQRKDEPIKTKRPHASTKPLTGVLPKHAIDPEVVVYAIDLDQWRPERERALPLNCFACMHRARPPGMQCACVCGALLSWCRQRASLHA
jgi:hypothetical protein